MWVFQGTYAQSRQCPHGVAATVLDKRPWNNFKRICDGAERVSLNANDRPRLGMKANTDRHFCRTTAGNEFGIEDDISCHGHGVSEIAVNFVKDILRRSSEENRAGFWVLALRQESEVSKMGQRQWGKDDGSRTRLQFFQY